MKKILAIILIAFTTTILSGCDLGINYYEDQVYSEDIYNEYSEGAIENDNNNIFTREKAIEKAMSVFEKGLDIKIDRTKLSESIRLYRESTEDTFMWDIGWNNTSARDYYKCVIDSSKKNYRGGRYRSNSIRRYAS